MRALGFEPRQEEVDRYVEKMQKNEAARAVNKDAFTLEELLHVIKDKLQNEDRNREIHSAFELFDTDGKGYIGYDDLKRVADELGENLKKEELWEMLREADKTSRGRVTEEDFKEIMKKTALY
ncbi:EF hand family protein [Aphelenchoides avenae]|nr:EF hand family protein [Aphelenchus avenae]